MASIIPSKVAQLLPKSSCLFLCDMQEKFRPTIKYFNEIVHNSAKLFKASQILDIPTIVTEQYPKGLGKTVPELGIEDAKIVPIEKTKFSMCVPPIIEQLQKLPNVDSILLCGIEAHVCVQQTALDLRQRGYNVFIIADSCSSRGLTERKFALRLMEQNGCWLTTTESAILSLTGGSSHPRFKEIQKLIIPLSMETGLENF